VLWYAETDDNDYKVKCVHSWSWYRVWQVTWSVLDADTWSSLLLLLLLMMMVMVVVEVNSLKLRHFDQRQFGVRDERHVTRVDQVAQSLGWRHAVLDVTRHDTLWLFYEDEKVEKEKEGWGKGREGGEEEGKGAGKRDRWRWRLVIDILAAIDE